jgi:hypothetical protein
MHSLPNIDPIICLEIDAPDLQAGNSWTDYQVNFEKDLPPTLADETNRLLRRVVRSNREFWENTRHLDSSGETFRSNLHVTLTSCVASKSDLTGCRLNESPG